jgi:hypothetical protein
MHFFDGSWNRRGDRDADLQRAVCERTKLDPTILGNPKALPRLSVAQRMSWIARRQPTRKENQACCMLGISRVYMPLLYR